jgi:phenylalanyl-tRNA synthetase beta chain
VLVPLSWLRDFAPFDLAPADLGATFDDLGMVVEGITAVGQGLDDVVVARVVEIHAIEGADKIRRVMVDIGGPDALQIVCGAWNFEVGHLVPLARVGAVLPGDVEITRKKMRGVVSDGMLCSPTELGLGTDAAGILVLPSGLEPGAPITAALGIEADIVFDLAI